MTARRPAPPRPRPASPPLRRPTPPPPPRRTARGHAAPPAQGTPASLVPASEVELIDEPSFDGNVTAPHWAAHRAAAPRAVERPTAPVVAPRSPTAPPAPVSRLESTDTRLSPPPIAHAPRPAPARPAPAERPAPAARPAPARPTPAAHDDVRRQRAEEARERGRAAARRLGSMAQMTEFHPGDIIADRYRVTSVLGRGRGLLLDAAHTAFEQRVVVRVISPALADAKAVDRFQRETRLLSQLETEHAARIIDVGTLPNGALYLVREYLDGVSLAEQAEARQLGVAGAIELFLQVCEAVQEAHSRGVVLRDLQPAHVFVTRKRNGEPVAKITDFGTCKVMKKADTEEESCTKLLGLSSSASPELVRQMKHIDERADIWSLGCLLYELLTGAPAFQGDGAMLMLAIANEEPLPPSSLRRDVDVPTAVDNAVMRALSKSRSRRFQTVYQFAASLRAYASPRGQLLIDQIARLAGEEPTSVTPFGVQKAPDSETSFAVSRSVPPSEPQRVYAAGAPFPLASPSSPALPLTSHPAPAAAAPSASSPASAPSVPQYDTYASIPASHASYPPVVAPLQFAVPPAPGLPAELADEIDATLARQARRGALRRALVAAAVVASPVAVVLVVFVLAQASPSPEVAQAGWDIPSVDAVVEEVEPEAPVAAEAASDEAPTSPPATRKASEVDVVADAPATDIGAAPGTAQQPSDASPAVTQFLGSTHTNKPAPAAKSKKKSGNKRESAKAPAADEPATGTGTIVAMAVGASCSFAVDGASRGSTSSIRVQVPAGRHTVSCQPVGGSRRSKSVTVEPGKAATAVFKF